MGTALLSIGVRAMAASYAQMQTTSHNIANAGVQGYSRQQTILATSPGQYTGVGFFGRGVDVVTVERQQDAFLLREATTAKALAAMDAARRDRLQQMETIFRTGEQGIGHSISQLFAAFSDLASRPADGSTREVVLAQAQDLTLRFNEAGEQLNSLQLAVNQELEASVTALNGLATNIAKVNNEISAAIGLGQQPNDLLDRRDQLISQLSEFVQVSTIAANDGTLGVFMGGGQRLVLGNVAERLQVTPDLFDGARSAVAISEGGSLRPLTSGALGGGSLAGLLHFQEQDLSAAQTMLGQLSLAVAGAVNEQQELGLSLNLEGGSPALGSTLFGFKAGTVGNVLPAKGNDPTITVSIDIKDPSQLKAFEYELRPDPNDATGWLLRHAPDDDWSTTIAANTPTMVDGFEVLVNASPTNGDRFLLQPVTRAASGIQRLLTDPLDVAAASPFVASTPAANTGTVAVNALRMVETPADLEGELTVTFTGPDPTDPKRFLYDWERRDALGNPVDGGAGLTWTPGKPIPAPPDVLTSLNGFLLDITGVPAAGDVIEVEPTPATHMRTNNGNALSLTSLGMMNLVGRIESGGTVSGGLTFNEGFIAAMADVGVRAQGAQAAASISAARAEQSEAAKVDTSGVNLDEEAARLIQYQQSYQAAAKVLQIAQQVFSELLDIAG